MKALQTINGEFANWNNRNYAPPVPIELQSAIIDVYNTSLKFLEGNAK